MNKKIIILILLSIILTLNQTTAILQAENAVIDINLDLPIEFEIKEGGFLQHLIVEFVMMPINDARQEVLSSEYSLKPESVEEGIVKFKITELEDIVIRSSFKVKTSRTSQNIYKKIEFPIKKIDPGMNKYLQQTDVFDINEEIESLAINLVREEDDLYKAVFKIADWVNKNIEYDLETLSQKKIPSSWVINNKKGVCTEYTALFVSLTRSLGIPSREISGIAYTDSELFPMGWGFHSWAEVYFPEHGWIPFDPTYGQYGFVSASHIKLGINTDAESRSNSFSWQGRDVKVNPKETELDVNIVSKTESQEYSFLKAETNLLEKEIGSNSFNVMEIILRNNNDFYVTETLRISGVDGLIFHTPRIKNIILAPREIKTLNVVVEIEKELERKFQYTFPLRFYLNEELYAEEFKASIGSTVLSEEDISVFLEKTSLSKDVLMCEVNPIIRVNEELNIGCRTEDKGVLCFEDTCEEAEKGITSLYVNITEPGLFTKPVVFENQEKKVSFVKFLVIDETSVDLSRTTHSKTLSPGESGDIKLIIAQESLSTPESVLIIIRHDYFEEEHEIGDIIDEFTFNFVYPARNLKKGSNEVVVEVIFYDALGKEFSESKTLEVEITGLTFVDEIDFFFRSVFYWLKNLW